MISVSMVCATRGRVAEVEHLLKTLLAQNLASIELIIVDQNPDDRLVPLIEKARGKLEINHIRMQPSGVSAARNAGFRSARGNLVTFPDDDCWYPPTLLADVETWFQAHPGYRVLAVACLDEFGVRSGNRWFQGACDLNVSNALRTTMCPTLFFNCTPAMRDVYFDEALNYGEDTDFCLRQLKTGIKGRLDSRLNVFHPCRDMLSGNVTADRAVKYGSGMGVLVRRHATLFLWFVLLAYDLLRAAVVACLGRIHDARIVIAHARGLTRGYMNAALRGNFGGIEERRILLDSEE